jgi:hypothetical protein
VKKIFDRLFSAFLWTIAIGLGIILAFFALMILSTAVCKATDLSPSIKTFAMCNGRDWSLGCDTSWEATHFDYIFVNMLDTNLVNAYKSYNPNIKMIQYNLMSTWQDGDQRIWNLMNYWCDSTGKDIEDMLIHLK